MDMSKDCMICGKRIGHRGFCSEKCHNEYYDTLENSLVVEKNWLEEKKMMFFTIKDDEITGNVKKDIELIVEKLNKVIEYINEKENH